jgi:hypothetical protein
VSQTLLRLGRVALVTFGMLAWDVVAEAGVVTLSFTRRVTYPEQLCRVVE